MNICVVYFSRTGNTRKFAQAIAEILKAPIYSIDSADFLLIEKSDLIVFGTPVEGAGPAKEAMTYVKNLPTVADKKVILFSTYRLFGNERTMKALENALLGKGYEMVLKISKKGIKPEQQIDFSKELSEIKNIADNLRI